MRYAQVMAGIAKGKYSAKESRNDHAEEEDFPVLMPDIQIRHHGDRHTDRENGQQHPEYVQNRPKLQYRPLAVNQRTKCTILPPQGQSGK